MSESKSVLSIFFFSSLCFGPLLLPLFPLLSVIFLNAVITPWPLGFYFLLMGIGPILYFFLAMKICYRQFEKNNSWMQKAIVVYVGWLVLLTPLLFLLLNGLGGASMSVVDGQSGSYWQRFPQYVDYTFLALLWGHIFIIPWIFLSIVILKRRSF